MIFMRITPTYLVDFLTYIFTQIKANNHFPPTPILDISRNFEVCGVSRCGVSRALFEIFFNVERFRPIGKQQVHFQAMVTRLIYCWQRRLFFTTKLIIIITNHWSRCIWNKASLNFQMKIEFNLKIR